MPDSVYQRLGQVRKQSEKAINVANISQNGKPQTGDKLISFFLHFQVDRVVTKGSLV